MDDPSLDIAVVGLSTRFPGADSADEFWEMLRGGVEATRRLTADELGAAGVPAEERDHPRYVPAWSGIEGADLFDPELFGYTRREATLIDPQHRLFLECSWEALEDAGITAAQFEGPIAVYAACGLNQYLLDNLLPRQDLIRDAGRLALAVASDKDNVATRVSYKLDLTGPSMTVQTNCSSAMVGLHHAVNSLLDFGVDAAVVGAASVKNAVPRGYLHELDGVNSPDGRCRSFDERAAGYFIGDGAGAVVLRRRQDAERDGDRIYAVIKATAVNNDGSAKVSFVAPSRTGQTAAIRAALRMGEIDPRSVQYVEANGSATVMGDAIEVAALEEAYGDRRDDPLLIGSVKPNVGNLDTASGLASFVKAVLAVHHGELPPSLHFEKPNPQTSLGSGPVRVNDALTPWPKTDGPRRAGVSSFGVGGTNVHVILEQAAEPTAATGEPAPAALITFSGASQAAAREVRNRLARYLADHPGTSRADAARTTQVGRRSLAFRGFAVVGGTGSAADAAALLAAAEPVPAAEDPSVGFVFPATAGPADELRAHLPAFRAAFEESAVRIAVETGVDVREEPAPAGLRTLATQHALAGLLAECGVMPAIRTGSGVGALTVEVVEDRLPLGEAARAVADGRIPPDGAPPLPEGMTALLVGDGADGLPLLGGPGGDHRTLLTAFGTLWAGGADIRWTVLNEGTAGRRTYLPPYPFQRVRCWTEPAADDARTGPAPAPATGGAARPSLPVEFVAPRSPLERVVADVWQRRLGLSGIGVLDSFLALGGDSLSAALVLTELNELFCCDLGLRAFLSAPTVAELAAVVQGLLREAAEIRAAFAAATENAEG